MGKLMSDTRAVLALAALVVVCTTLLVALDKVCFADAAKTMGGMVGGLLLAWQRGVAKEPAVEVVKVEEEKKP
jgi:hypothetical protein